MDTTTQRTPLDLASEVMDVRRGLAAINDELTRQREMIANLASTELAKRCGLYLPNRIVGHLEAIEEEVGLEGIEEWCRRQRVLAADAEMTDADPASIW